MQAELVRRSLFLSHASEDKQAFVNALAEKLNAVHQVWYDQYSLKVGDSIFESISRGLRTCDYGVVVLSRNFFSKKWTRAKLDRCSLLSGRCTKLFYPVWLGVSYEEVLDFSPILADRKAALASDGVESVARALDFAISATAEARSQESGISAISRAAKLSEDTALRTTARSATRHRTGKKRSAVAFRYRRSSDYSTDRGFPGTKAFAEAWEGCVSFPKHSRTERTN